MNSEINLKFEIDKTTVRLLVILAALIAIIVVGSRSANAQEVDETIRVNTRVVFMDALVKDKRTGVPIADLKPENFEIYDNGTLRPTSYFMREGQARKPLALVLILDLRDSGAGRYLKRPEVLKIVADELAKLSPQDEVAILAMDTNGDYEKRLWLSGFTRDPAELVAALARAPHFIDVDSARDGQNEPRKQAGAPDPGTPKSDDIMEVEIIKGKNGSVIRRTTRKNGSADVERVKTNGDVTVEFTDIYDLAAAVKETTRKAKQERPTSQLAIVWVSDGIAPIFFEDRDATEQMLVRSNVIFNSLTAEMRTLFKLLMPIGKPIAGMMGISVYGSAKRLAQQTGGEAVKVSRVRDFGSGLSKIIGNLTARYSLGFTLAEDEKDDGRLHNLEVRVKAPDAKGKLRKLEVSSRRSYYISETGEKDVKEATAAKTP